MFRCQAKTVTATLLWVALLPASQYGWARDGLLESAWGPAYVLGLVSGAVGLLALWRTGGGWQRSGWTQFLPGLSVSFVWSLVLWLLVGAGRGGASPFEVVPARSDPLGTGQVLAMVLGGAGVMALSWGPVVGRGAVRPDAGGHGVR